MIIGIFQIVGIISFGLGGSLGSLLLSHSVSLEIITYIGAGIILFNIIIGGIGLALARKRKAKQQKDTTRSTEEESDDIEEELV